MSPSLASLLDHTPTNCHQETPTEIENILKLQNVQGNVRHFVEETKSKVLSQRNNPN